MVKTFSLPFPAGSQQVIASPGLTFEDLLGSGSGAVAPPVSPARRKAHCSNGPTDLPALPVPRLPTAWPLERGEALGYPGLLFRSTAESLSIAGGSSSKLGRGKRHLELFPVCP